ncbi:MAG: hypothetical protein JEZ06_17510 [Anaerolineaceae bacterium]|nr:hypothetical protein [Anaerolineaceae bacterium]
MNNKIFLLLKPRLIAQLGINTFRYEKDKSKRNSKWAVMISLIIVFLVMAGYCGAYAYGLCYLGISELVPVYAFFICSVISLFFTIFKTPGELFGFRDFDFLMSIPVKVSTVIASRFFSLYLWNTFISTLIMLPMGIVYAIYENPGFLFYPMWFLGILITCFIPTTIAVIIGALLTAVASKFKHTSMAGAILLILFSIIFIVGPFALPSSNFTTVDGSLNQEYLFEILPMVSGMIYEIYPPAKLFDLGVVGGNLMAFFKLVLISVGWYLLFIWTLSFRYKKINTAISSYHVTSDYEVNTLKQGNAFSALYQKEIRRWIGSSVYFSNTIMGIVMALLFAGALLMFGPEKLVEAMNEPLAAGIVVKVAVFAISACLCMCCTTAASISLEGKNLWLLQSLPLHMKTIIDSKLLVNLTISVPGALISSTMLVMALKPGLAGALIYYIVPFAFVVFTAVWGLMINLKLPNYDWESETQVVKQSFSTVLGMFPEMLLAIILAVLVGVLPIDYRLIGLVSSIFFLVSAWLLYSSMINKYRNMPL